MDKGRVARVLPGMEAAFVDIGVERDAFLYVSDFRELENEDGDLEAIPASLVQDFSRPAVSEPVAAAGSHGEAQSTSSYAPSRIESHASEPRESSGGTDQRDSRGGWRGRRRRGRRDHSSERGSERGSERSSERSPDRGPERSQEQTRFSRPPQNESRPEREHYGPPPRYQPIILPAESISKNRRLRQPGPAVEKPDYAADE